MKNIREKWRMDFTNRQFLADVKTESEHSDYLDGKAILLCCEAVFTTRLLIPLLEGRSNNTVPQYLVS